MVQFVVMGAARRSRANHERTFLEHVESILQRIQSEVADVKNTMEVLSRKADFVLPPSAPPPLDVYNRSFLIEFRDATTKPPEVALPTARSLTLDLNPNAETFFPAFQSAIEIDMSEMNFIVDDDMLEATMPTQNCKNCDCANLIANAQHEAFICRRRENAAIYRIQKFWRACKERVKRCPRPKWIGSYGASGAECNDAESSIALESHFLELRNVINAPGFVIEFASFLKNTDINSVLLDGQEATVGATTSHEDNVALPVHVGSCGTAMDRRVKGAVHKPRVKREDEFIEPILAMAKDVPLDRRPLFCYMAIKGLAERHEWKHDIFDSRLDILEEILGVSITEVLPFSCTDCGETFERQVNQCTRCNGDDIFDIRTCQCNHLGICGTGCCNASLLSPTSSDDEHLQDNFS